MATRDAKGRFLKGHPGNPNATGRPRKTEPTARGFVRAFLEEAERGAPRTRNLLAEAYRIALGGEKDTDRLAAIKWLWEAGHGRPATADPDVGDDYTAYERTRALLKDLGRRCPDAEA